MSEINRDSELLADYSKMLKTESHHDHKIVIVNDVFRWQESIPVNGLLENISLNDLCPLLNVLGYGKNSEIYRKLYRDMGYSLSGYYEIFYWDFNNEDADNYRQPDHQSELKKAQREVLEKAEARLNNQLMDKSVRAIIKGTFMALITEIGE